jgi:hypothetical protein
MNNIVENKYLYTSFKKPKQRVKGSQAVDQAKIQSIPIKAVRGSGITG